MTDGAPLWLIVARSPRAWLQVLTLAAMAALIAWRLDLAKTWDVFTAIAPGYAILGVMLLVASNVAHARKWQYLLAGLGRVPLREAFAIFWSSMTTNNVIPLRAGDLLRVQVMSQRTGLPRPGIVASLFTERLLDGLSFLVLLAFALVIQGRTNYVNFWALGVLAVFLLVAGGTVAAARSRPEGEIEHSLAIRMLPHPLRGPAAELMPQVVAGLRPLGQLRSGVEVTAWAIFAWMLEALAFIAWGEAFGLDVPATAFVLVMVAVNLTSSITLLPANVGLFELTAVGILRAAGIGPSESAAYAVGTHLLIIATISLIGLGTLAYLRLGLDDVFYLRRRAESREPAPAPHKR